MKHKRLVWLVVAFALVGCKVFDPVHSENLCGEDELEWSMWCPQCRELPYAARCSICRRDAAAPEKCMPASTPDGIGMTDGGDPPDGQNPSGGMSGGGEGPAGAGSGEGSAGSGEGGGGMSAGQGALPPVRGCDEAGCVEEDPSRPVCNVQGQCVECTSKQHCAEGEVCNMMIERCQNCMTDADCASKHCDEMLNVCVDCEKDMDCPQDSVKNNCDTRAHQCVDCVTDLGCQDGTVFGTCDERAFKCVDCVDDGDCDEDGKGTCDIATRTCVGCLEDSDCHDNINATCDKAKNVCVDCMDDGGCVTGTNNKCDIATQKCVQCTQDVDCPSQLCLGQQCVACKVDGDCPTPQAGRCDPLSHTCGACTSNAQCEHLTATPVCDAGSGSCVPCNDDSTCGGKACLRASHQCSTVTVGSLDICRPCEADTQCKSNMKCVPLTFGTTALGNYCVWTKSSRGTCASAAPYSRELASTRSVDGTLTSYCGPPNTTTCEGVLDATTIPGGKYCENNVDCGREGLTDGICADGIGCTYVCVTNVDCTSQLTCVTGNQCGAP